MHNVLYRNALQRMSLAAELRKLSVESQKSDSKSVYNQIITDLKEVAKQGLSTFSTTKYYSVPDPILGMLREEGVTATFKVSGSCDCDYGCRGSCISRVFTATW